MRVPVATPAGTLIFKLRRERTRPSPEHSVHGSGITVPKPWQAEHWAVVITCPRNERATRWTVPRPPHTSQVRGSVPGAQQEPSQTLQTTAVSTVTSSSVPKTASDKIGRAHV